MRSLLSVPFLSAGSLSALITLLLSGNGALASFTTEVTHVEMIDYIAQTRPWTVRIAGQCGVLCATPRRMYSNSCQNKLFVAWASHEGMTPNRQYPEENLFDELSAGHISTFEIASDGGATLVSDHKFDWCNDMGGVEVSADCSVIAVLCRSHRKASDPANGGDVRDFVEENKNGEDEYNFGWHAYSIDDPTAEGYRPVDNMYLLEFTSGAVTPTPDRATVVSQAIGGWNYGHWEVSLNNDLTVYTVDLKTTIGGPGPEGTDNFWHEGETNYAINRADLSYVQELSAGWACGPGHILANRVTHNKALDTWSRLCLLDGNVKEVPGWSISWATVGPLQDTGSKQGTNRKSVEDPTQLRFLSVDDRSTWDGYGGPTNTLSLGADGFLAISVGVPAGKGATIRDRLGILKLPADGPRAFEETPTTWQWLDLPKRTEDAKAARPDIEERFGLAQLEHFGSGGETGKRFLLGYSPAVEFQGVVQGEFMLAEMDVDGCVLGEPVPYSTTGWTEDTLFTYMPDSGCVAWPATWLGGENEAGGEYHPSLSEDLEKLTKRLSITVVCPSAEAPTCTRAATEYISGAVRPSSLLAVNVLTPLVVAGLLSS